MRDFNADMGQKDFFEIGSKKVAIVGMNTVDYYMIYALKHLPLKGQLSLP